MQPLIPQSIDDVELKRHERLEHVLDAANPGTSGTNVHATGAASNDTHSAKIARDATGVTLSKRRTISRDQKNAHIIRAPLKFLKRQENK